MSVWVLFFALRFFDVGASFQYEFKSKEACLHALGAMAKRWDRHRGFCLEVRK